MPTFGESVARAGSQSSAVAAASATSTEGAARSTSSATASLRQIETTTCLLLIAQLRSSCVPFQPAELRSL